MLKKILFLFLSIFCCFSVFAQPINISGEATTGKVNSGVTGGCPASSGQPVLSCKFIAQGQGGTVPGYTGNGSGPGSNAAGGVINVTDPCDTTILSISMTNIQWFQDQDVNWVHGVFFPSNAGLTFVSTTLAPANWIFTPLGCTGINGINPNSCGVQAMGGNAGTVGGQGYYFRGPNPGCCPGGGGTATPCDNWGDGQYNCGVPLFFSFVVKLCNSSIPATGGYTLKVKLTADGNTGCWSMADTHNNSIVFTLATSSITLYNPAPAAPQPTVSCTPAVTYTTTLTGGCGNGTTISWWTASTGGTQIGTGSPFTYTTSTCSAGTTLYAQCCPPTNTCTNRKAFAIAGVNCPSVVGVTGTTVTQPTCSTPTGSVTVTAAGGSGGPYTYTISPGGTSNSTGIFGSLAPGAYTVTVQDASCTASTSFTINAATTGGPGPTVTTPVNYCVGATAVPLTAPGTNDLWYTVATGGTGSATSPTPSTTTAGSTTYYVSQNPTGTCESVRSAITVIVTANSTITLTSAATTNAQTVCVGTMLTNIVYTTGAGATGATVSPALPAGVTGMYSGGTNGTYTISGTPTGTGSFPYTITTSGGCGAATATGTITVSTAATMTLSSAASTANQTLCINTPITPITYSVGGGATGATVSTLPAGLNGSFAGGTFTISGTPSVSSPTASSYTVTTTGGCGTVTLSGTITVNPNVTITLTSAAPTSSQTVCVNTAITNIVYTTANGATGVTISPALPAGLTGTYSGGTNGTYTIIGTPAAAGTYSYTVTTSGGCMTPSQSGTITVSTAATMTLSSATPTANQTLCINTPLTPITYSVGGGATGATVTGLPAGVNGAYSGGTFTISGTPTVSSPTAYSYTVTTTGGCGTVTLSGTITVNPNVTITLTSAAATSSQTVCVNTAITNIVYTTANGATGVTISPALPAGLTGTYSGGTNGTYTISGTGTANYSFTVTTSGGCTTPSQNGSITVTPNATITLTSPPATTTQTVNINTPITTITYGIGGSATSATVTGLPTGVTGTYSGGVFTISGTPSVSGTFPYTVTTSGGCTNPNLSGTITINNLVTLTLSSAAATNNQTICINAALVNITYASTNGVTGIAMTAGSLPTGVTGSYSGGTDGTYTITGIPTVSGSFNYTLTTSGGTGTATQSGTITVTPAVTIVRTSAAATTAQTVCITVPVASIVYTTGNGATGATVSGLPAGVTGMYSGGTNGTFTISGSPTVSSPMAYSYTVTTTGGCGTASLGGTITVNPNVTVTAASPVNQTLCIGTSMTAISFNTANGVTGATISGLPTGVSGSYSGGTNGTFMITGAPSVSGSFPYTITTSGGCGTATINGSITVNANVTLTLSSAAATSSQTICINSMLTAITYAAGSGATGATVTTLPAGLSGNFSGGIFTISGTPTVSGMFSYTVTTSGGCSTAQLSGTININPAATITLTSAAPTAAQTLCINTMITNIVYTTATGATGASATGLPAGVTGTYSGSTFTISGTPSVSGTFPYTVTTSGGCGTAPISGTITVNANVTLTLSSGAATNNQTACINTGITPITYAAGSGATGASVTGLPTGVTGNYAGGTFTITGTPSATGIFPYTVTTSGGCSTATANGTITVNPNVTLALTSATATTTQTICINMPVTGIAYATGNGATGAMVTGLPAGVTGTYSGGTNGTFTITGTPTVSTGSPYNYTVTTTGGCSIASLTGSIIVKPNVTITAASTVNQTLCINMVMTAINFNTANGVTGATISGLPSGVSGMYSGGTNGTFTIAGTPALSGSFPYTITTSGGCSTGTATGTITVNPNVTVTLSSAASTTSQTICISSPLTNIVYATGSVATGATVSGLPAGLTGTYSGGTNGTFTISGSPTVSGNFPYTVTVTGACSTTQLSGTININPAATIALTSAASTATQTLCINTMITNIVYTTATGATGASATGLPAGVTGTYSGSTFTISGTPSVSGTFPYTVTTSGGCGTASLSGTITVNPNVTLTLSSGMASAAQTVCINTAITNITYNSANGTGATVSGLPAGVSGNYSAGIFTISGTPSVAGTYAYTVMTTGGCSSASLQGTIVVNPNVTLTLSSASATTNQTLCVNTVINNIVYTTANGATGATVTGLPTGVSGNYSGGTFTISGLPTVSGTFNYTASTTGGCTTASLGGTITVIAIPPAPGVTSPVNKCPGDVPTQLTATGTNLLWYTTATGGTGSTTAPTPQTTTPGSTTYYVSQSTTAASCEGPRAAIVVNVNNGLSIYIGKDTTICQGDSVHFIPVVNPPALSYTWRSISPRVPNSTIDSLNTLETTVHPVDTAQYVLHATNGNCAAEDTVQVNVRLKPIVDAGPNKPICVNDSTLLSGIITHFTGPVDSLTFQWSPAADSIRTPTALQTYVKPAHSSYYTLTVTATPGKYGCTFVSTDSVKVIVQPPVIAFAGHDTIGVKGIPHQLHGEGGTDYTWSSPTPNVQINNSHNQNATVVLNDDANIQLIVRDAIGCSDTTSVFIKVYEGPQYLVPNAFSPNGDGLNDVFRAIPPGISVTTYFRVFNRYGQLLFETDQYLKGWDGTYKGQPQPQGVYVWMVKGTDRNKRIVEAQGTVTLIR